jgi:L-ascorbate metabolism protein UlaG (beta-lactamase superfamily)
MSSIKIQWLGHACFKVSKDDYSIVFDPYGDGDVPGLKKLRVTADEVILSHDHSDHNAVGNVTISVKQGSNPFSVTKLHSFHDECFGKKRGKNEIAILESDGIRIAHMGDIGCIPDKEQLEKLKGLDAMMVPVGGYYTMEPALVRELINMTGPAVVIPMHYRSDTFGYPVIGTLAEFLHQDDPVRYYDIDSITISKNPEKQIAVLKYDA